MAELSEEDRLKVWRGVMRFWSAEFDELTDVEKAQLKSAVDATDTWIENNQASFNSALPDPFKTQATLAQKTLVFCAVSAARVSIPFLRKMFGEVD